MVIQQLRFASNVSQVTSLSWEAGLSKTKAGYRVRLHARIENAFILFVKEITLKQITENLNGQVLSYTGNIKRIHLDGDRQVKSDLGLGGDCYSIQSSHGGSAPLLTVH